MRHLCLIVSFCFLCCLYCIYGTHTNVDMVTSWCWDINDLPSIVEQYTQLRVPNVAKSASWPRRHQRCVLKGQTQKPIDYPLPFWPSNISSEFFFFILKNYYYYFAFKACLTHLYWFISYRGRTWHCGMKLDAYIISQFVCSWPLTLV